MAFHLCSIFIFVGLYRENIFQALSESGDGNAWKGFINIYEVKHQIAIAGISTAVSLVLANASFRFIRSYKKLKGYPPKRPLPPIYSDDYKGPFRSHYDERYH